MSAKTLIFAYLIFLTTKKATKMEHITATQLKHSLREVTIMVSEKMETMYTMAFEIAQVEIEKMLFASKYNENNNLTTK